MLAGWSTLSTGAFRLHLIELEKANAKVSWWHCIGTPVIVLEFSMILQTIMLLVVSIDRFIAIKMPLKYFTFTRKYAIGMVFFCFILTAVFTVILVVYAYIVDKMTRATADAICIYGGELDGLFTSMYYIRLVMVSLSVLIYAIVWFLFRRYQNAAVATFPTIKTHLCKTQSRLTTTVGICALFTFVLYVIPTILMYSNLNPHVWAPIICVINCFNGVVNVFVYSLRHEDIRRGLKLLFLCKQLPSQAEQRLRKESLQSFGAKAKAAFIVMEHMGVVASEPKFQELQSISNASY
jgi:hypothetical protein